MRYMTLQEMRDMLRDESNISRNVAHGVTQIDQQNRLIQRVQEDLYLNFDWPHLRAVASVALGAEQRWSAYPDTFEFTGIDRVWWQHDEDDQWRPIEYGISALELNEVDSEAGETETDVRRWQNYMQPAAGEEEPGEPTPPITGDTGYNMFEVWPVPTDGGNVRFEGKRKLFPLDADDKTSTIDGPCIVLHAAAEILARQKSEDASLKLQLGRERLRLLRMRQTVNDTRVANLGGGVAYRPLRPGIDYLDRIK
jgi:hypothetical protein